MQNREELRQKGNDGSQKTKYGDRGKNIIFRRRGWDKYHFWTEIQTPDLSPIPVVLKQYELQIGVLFYCQIFSVFCYFTMINFSLAGKKKFLHITTLEKETFVHNLSKINISQLKICHRRHRWLRKKIVEKMYSFLCC